ncbi:MAG: hypothetical protein OEY64_01915 [Nitrospinota bacterium]|nr:hypothetical protein [Nitrospinota bacterium]
MSVIIQGSVQGKLGEDTPNVLAATGDKPNHKRQASGFMKLVTDNNAKVAEAHSTLYQTIKPKNTAEIVAMTARTAMDATPGQLESGKGNKIASRA